MTFIPPAFCADCGADMKCTGIAVRLQVIGGNKKPYYKIKGDEYTCPDCGHKVYIRMAEEPYALDYQPDFNKVGHDEEVRLVTLH